MLCILFMLLFCTCNLVCMTCSCSFNFYMHCKLNVTHNVSDVTIVVLCCSLSLLFLNITLPCTEQKSHWMHSVYELL